MRFKIAALTLALATVSSAPVRADQPGGGLTPVPPMRSVPQPLNPSGDEGQSWRASKKLAWRASSKFTPAQQPHPTQTIDTAQSISPAQATGPVRLPNHVPAQAPAQAVIQTAQQESQTVMRRPLSVAALMEANPLGFKEPPDATVGRVAYTQDIPNFNEPGQLPSRAPGPSANRPAVDPFSDPFGDTSKQLIIQPPAGGFQSSGGAAEPPAVGGIRLPDPPALPQNSVPEATEPLPVSPFSAPDISENSQIQIPSNDFGDSPSDLDSSDLESEMSEFDQAQRERDQRREEKFQRLGEEDLDMDLDRPFPGRENGSTQQGFGSQRPKAKVANCDELRARIASRTIRDVTLDISPPFRPDVLEKDEFEKLREEFLDAQVTRTWRNREGSQVAEGRLIDLAYEAAVIETDTGSTIEIPLSRIAESDLAYITEAWGLPQECQLPNLMFQPRQWLPLTMTWKASGLCHKPLYFEEVNLERYGHTAGPFVQPVISTAHFFVNIAVLPYKMGMHPPDECQYALGYYRPGNCAPWIIPPVPLSLRGALYQTGAVAAGIVIIP